MTYMRSHEEITCSNKTVQTEQSIYLSDVEEHMLYFIRTYKISILRLCTLCYGVVYNYSAKKYTVETEPILIDSDSDDEDPPESPEKNKYISASCVDQSILEALHKNYKRPPKTARNTVTESSSRQRYRPNSIISVKEIGINTDISGNCHARTEAPVKSNVPNITASLPQRRDMDLSSSRSMDVNPKTFILNRWAQESNTSQDSTSQMDSSNQSPPVSRKETVQITESRMIPPIEYNDIIHEQLPSTQQQPFDEPVSQNKPVRTDPSSVPGSSGSVLKYHLQTLLPSAPDRGHDGSPETPIPLVKKVTENEQDIFCPRPKSVFNPGPGHEYVSPHTLYYPPSTHFDRMELFGRNELGNHRFLPYPNLQQYSNTENMNTLDLSSGNHLMMLQKQHQQLLQQQEQEQRYVQGLHHMPNQPQQPLRTSPPQQQPQEPQLNQQMESPPHHQQIQPPLLHQSMIHSQQYHQMPPPAAVNSYTNDIPEPDREEPAPKRPRIEQNETNLRNTRIERPQPAPKTYSRKQVYTRRNSTSDWPSNIATNNIVASHMAASNMTVTNMPSNDIMPANNMALNNLAANNMPPNNIAANIMAANKNIATNNIAANNIAANIMAAANNMAGNNMAANNMPATSTPNNSQMFQRGHMGQQWPNSRMPSIAMHQGGQHQAPISQNWPQRPEALHHGRWPVPGCSCAPCIRMLKIERYRKRQ
ncbi:GATA zinc finger domain-containing protein 10-like [Ostrinia furnacalis]|uniref:GATA zinc finger domain-containing protein 10-like n=1 Tax=Ostrinia furnacalis TaxID=93504 RepID=UPI00103C84DB|nr:GATA zinc finger domain-containing protein 10-like [Ostrinia furnacalis]